MRDQPDGVSRRDWLLLYLSPTALGLDENRPLTPVQIQKGMFLLTMRGRNERLYEFEPYHWGPFSSEIYDDLRILEVQGLVAAEEIPFQNWKAYTSTESGTERAIEIASVLGNRVVEWVASTRSWVTARSFTRLLQDVYSFYPNYATKSMLR